MCQRAAPGALRRAALAGAIALALLALGEALPAAFPVWVALDVHGDQVVVQADGQAHTVATGAGGWRAVRFEQPGPQSREYQVDGTDLTFTLDRDVGHILALQGTALYTFDGWLRDEASFSRWERVRLVDPESGAALAQGKDAVEAAPLPASFHLEAAVRRMEAPARLWLLRSDDGVARQGVELDRDGRHIRWLTSQADGTSVVASWFFPEDPMPFVADLAQLLGRSAAAAFAMFAVVCLVASAAASVEELTRGLARLAPSGVPRMPHHNPGSEVGRWLPVLALSVWLVAATWVSVRLYGQLPHVLDAVSYAFQAGVFRSGHLWLAAPPEVDALKGPFEVVWHGRWFSQYPPGAPAAYALGDIVGLGWLVGPVAGVVMLGATAWSARALFGPRAALLTLGLGVTSPFILFQAGSFLSHPISGAWLALALAAFAHAERRVGRRWYVAVGALLGAAFLVRETAAVLFALPLLGWLALHRRWRPVSWLLLGGVPWVLVYFGYNAALTGSPLTLPRALFDPHDHFGFGDGIGFYGRHTPAAGLVVADELLTLLQFDLFGWPPLFGLGVLVLPLLVSRPTGLDLLLVMGTLTFVAGHTLYFANGVALGPRYYYEALPWMLPLAARGLLAAAAAARDVGARATSVRVGLLVLVGVLCLNTALYYLPRQVERRVAFKDLPYRRRADVPFVATSASGPRPMVAPAPALVITDDWWLQNVVLAPLSCRDLGSSAIASCPAIFAFAAGPADVSRLRQAYPERTVLRAVDRAGVVDLVPW